MKAALVENRTNLPKRSLAGLNAANFFQAEMVGVVLPVLSAYLREAHWRYDQIGLATAIAGLGTLLLQTPAGWITDRFSCRRLLFALLALTTGACFGLIPLTPATLPLDELAFVPFGSRAELLHALARCAGVGAGGTPAA